MELDLLQFWGKARPGVQAAVVFHPALLHCIDVAAVAAVLAEHSLASGLGPLAPALPFLTALHDLGKFTRGFQGQCPEHWPVAFGPFRRVASPRHDTTGYWLLRLHCGHVLDAVLPGTPARARAALLQAIGGHHGRPPAMPPEGDDDPYPQGLCPVSVQAAQAAAEALAGLFRPPAVPPIPPAEALRLSWRLAGVITLADWLGSGAHFPYVDGAAVADLPAYLRDHALPRARAAVAEAGLAPVVASPFTGLRGLFPGIPAPSPSQAWAEGLHLPDGPVLALIEDVTGSGKTEAALTLAHKLIAEGRAEGLFVALPTMATAGAMFARLSASYRGLFGVGGHPSLVLAHGRAMMDERFTATILDEAADGDLSDGDLSASSQCAAWLADSRRKALLAQVGVGTVDQVLLAVLPARHAALRQFGLARKVLIVDEVHAYDQYMRAELGALLQMHAAGGGSAVLLSATLTGALRRQLVAAFTSGLGAAAPDLTQTAYPLATLASSAGASETPCAMRDRLARRVAVRRLEDAAAAVAAIAVAVAEGAAVAWIRNTVDDAIAGQAALAEVGMEAILFHARFAMADRLAIEGEVLRRFGKESSDRRGLVVATQVIEMSLDLDFDLIVTDMAPADMLIQRAGRLWRHPLRTDRPLPQKELLLVGPAPIDDPGVDWLSGVLPGAAAIYPTPLVWRSARAVLAAGVIETPGNVRDLVEAAYDEDSAVPPGLERAEQKRLAERYKAASLAQMNVLAMEKGYSAAAGAWDSDTRTPTRLEDEASVTLRLAKVVDGRVVPWAGDPTPDIAWAMSEVRVAARRVADLVLPPPLKPAAEAARAGWKRWEREASEIKLVVLVPEGVRWRADAVDAKGKPVSFYYSSNTGIHRQ